MCIRGGRDPIKRPRAFVGNHAPGKSHAKARSSCMRLTRHLFDAKCSDTASCDEGGPHSEPDRDRSVGRHRHSFLTRNNGSGKPLREVSFGPQSHSTDNIVELQLASSRMASIAIVACGYPISAARADRR